MDMINLMRYAAAMLLVLALAGAAMLVKRYGGIAAPLKGGLKLKMGNWDFSQSPRRLAIVETLMLGPRQRLFIIRRDNVEHLVLSGPDGATVIENGIKAQNNFGVTP